MYDEKKESHIKWKHKCQGIRNNKEQKRSLKETAVRKLGTHRKSTKKRTTECGREREQQNYKTNTPEIANHITFLKAFFMRLFLLIHFHFITLRFFSRRYCCWEWVHFQPKSNFSIIPQILARIIKLWNSETNSKKKATTLSVWKSERKSLT